MLVLEGIPAGRVVFEGMGPDRPTADSKTKEGQAKSRRVEIDMVIPGIQARRSETSVFAPMLAPTRKKVVTL